MSYYKDFNEDGEPIDEFGDVIDEEPDAWDFVDGDTFLEDDDFEDEEDN